MDTAIDKAGDIVDKKTQGKYTQHVDKVQDAAKKAVDKNTADQTGQVPPTQQSGQAPPSAPRQGTRRSSSPRRPHPPPSTYGQTLRLRRRPVAAGEGVGGASDLSRYKEWLSIHRVWRSKLPETLEKGTVIESIVEVKGMPNRIKWTIVHYKPPEAMTLERRRRRRRQGQTHRQGQAVSD